MSARIYPLSAPERAKHLATHIVKLQYTDLIGLTGASTAATAVAAVLFAAKAGTRVEYLGHRLVTPFANGADAAFNTNTSKVGDGTDDDRFGLSQELNLNGTYVPVGPVSAPATTQPYLYGADTNVLATIGSMTGKKISDLTQGEVHYLFRLTNLKKVSDSVPG
ncbi:MAG TPA: hypothetical protein VHC95_07080 [Opitutales bacterium]|nr:hypothetical protein [Opitutales bacterium]